MVIRLGFSHVSVLSDSACLSALLTGKDHGPISIAWSSQDVRSTVRSLDSFTIRKVSRHAVRSAHVLASSALRRQLIRYRF